MKYDIKPIDAGKKVTITFTDDNFFRDSAGEVKQKDFEVIKKEEIYEMINKNKPINLNDKYVKGFSLTEYRMNNQLAGDTVINKGFQAENAFFESDENGTIDFSGAVFKGSSVSFYHTTFGNGVINFMHSRFEDGDVNFEGVNFGDRNVVFTKTNFGDGNINFTFTNFGKGNVYFSNAEFGTGKVDFTFAYFREGVVYFGYATFKGKIVDFKGATFGEGSVDFSSTTFKEGVVDFHSATFDEGTVNFKKTNFGDADVKFGVVTWKSKKVSFRGAKISRIGFRGNSISGEWDMRVVKADLIDFSDTIIHGIIDFGFFNNEGNEVTPKVKEIRMINTKLPGKIYLDYEAFGLESAINSQDSSHREKRDQFRLFKENFRTLGQYEDEDKAYVQFRKHWLREGAGFVPGVSIWTRIKRFPFFVFKWLVFEQMGLYGTNPFRVFLSMIVVWAIFSFRYYPLTHLLEPQAISLPSKFGIATYHSIITFLTIGYGDFFPTGSLRFWSGVEGFLGLFLMAYFTVSFVRKVLR